jgi:hypothetical protein
MRSFQQMLLILTGNSTNLLIQIAELNELRKRLSKAEQSAQKGRSRSGKKERHLTAQHIPQGR